MLNADEVVKRVRVNFVPVALNADRLPAGAVGDFYRALLARWPQGLWVVTPTGQTLGFHYHTPTPGDTFAQNQARWIRATCTMLDEALRAAGPLPPRPEAPVPNPFPDRGVGRTSDDGVRLAVTVTGVRNCQPEGSPVADSVVLSAEDWATFTPPPGQPTWPIPAETARKFAPTLSPLTDLIFVPQPEHLTTATLTGSVVRPGVVRFQGKWASKHLRDGQANQPVIATLSGEAIGTFDPTTGEWQEWFGVFRGSYQKGPGVKPQPIAVIVEWRAN